MNKEMKKNNKMLLALVVVAALAMVSVAGAALSNSSDAAYRLDEMKNGTTILTSDDSNLSAEFYILAGGDFGVQYVKIAEGATISGKISVGTADDNNGKNYVEYASVTLKGVSNAVLTLVLEEQLDGTLVGYIFVGDDADIDKTVTLPYVISNYRATTGTFEITKGALIAGAIRSEFKGDIDFKAISDASKLIAPPNGPGNLGGNLNLVYTAALLGKTGAVAPFTGTIICEDSELKASYIYGMAVGPVDGKAMVYGEVVTNATTLPWEEVTKPVDDPATIGIDESLFYTDAGIPQMAAVDPVLACIPVFGFSEMNVTFVSGDFSVGFPAGFIDPAVGNVFRLVNVNGVVEADANVIVGDNSPSIADKVVVSIPQFEDDGVTPYASINDLLYLLPEKGKAIESNVPAVVNATDKTIEFTFNGVSLNTLYYIAGYFQGPLVASGDEYPYFSTFEVSGSGASYSIILGGNMADDMLDVTGLAAVGTDMTFTYADVDWVEHAFSSTVGRLDVNNSASALTGTIKDALKDPAAKLFILNSFGGKADRKSVV
jgi:hypothetical protein